MEIIKDNDIFQINVPSGSSLKEYKIDMYLFVPNKLKRITKNKQWFQLFNQNDDLVAEINESFVSQVFYNKIMDDQH